MALREQEVAIRFAGGIETKQDAKAVPTAKLLVLENGVFTKAVSIVKRNGYEDLDTAIDGSTSPLAGVTRLAKRDDELLAFTRTRGYSYDADSDRWADAGAVFSVAATDQPLVRTGTDQTMPDHATNGGVTAAAWEDSRGGVWWSAVAASTGRVYRAPEQLDAGGSRPRCVPCGDVLHVYWVNGAFIMCVVVNPSTPSAAPVPIRLIPNLDGTNPSYDAEPTTYAGAPALIAWADAGTGAVRIAFVHPSGVIGGPATALPPPYWEASQTVIGPIAVTSWKSGAAARVAVIACINASVYAFYYSVSGAGLVLISSGPATLTNAVNEGTLATRVAAVMLDDTDATTGKQPVYVAWERTAAQPSERFVRSDVVNAAAANPLTLRSVGLCTRAFQVAGEPFVSFVHDTTYFNTYFAARLTDLCIVGRMLPGLAAGAPTRGHLSSAHVAGDIVALCLPYRERLTSENHDQFTETGIRLVSLDFDSDASHQSAQLGRGLYMAGACPLHYDGHLFTELGFHVGPELITSAKAGGGALTASSTYEYIAWYEWPDGQGEVHRGPTSIGTVVVLGGGETKVTLTLPMLRLTSKPNVRICVARCRANDQSDFFRVTSLDPNTAGADNGYVANDPTVDSVTLVDILSDADLQKQEPLYTNGGILSNDPPALGVAVAVGKSRLFFSDPADPNVLHYSQELDVGYGAEMPPELVIRCDPYGGAITAIAVMDEQVIIFKEHALYAFGGDGPLPSGDSSQTGFSNPALVTSDVGCTDPASIVVTPVGLMFMSAKGFFLLDRGRQLQYVGAAAEAFNAQTIRRGTVKQDSEQIVFLTDSGKTLMYDHFYQQWSTFTNHEGYDALIVGGLYHYLRTDGRVFRETPGAYSDAGRQIVLRLETAWIKMVPHLQGFARFWFLHILGERKSPHQLRVQFRTDYSTHWSEPEYLNASGSASPVSWITEWGGTWLGSDDDPTITGTVYGEGPYGEGDYGGVGAGPYQWRVHLNEVGQAIQFRFEDYEGADIAGPAFEITELLLTGGVKSNAVKPFTASRST